MSSLPGPAGLPDSTGASESVWRSPLLPAALAVTAGVVFDRCAAAPFYLVVFLAAGALAAFAAHRLGGQDRLALVYLALVAAAAGAAYHHFRRTLRAADDIGRLAGDEPRAVRLRGVFAETPRRLPADRTRQAPWKSEPQPSATAVLRVTHVHEPTGERAISGLVRLVVTGRPATEPLAGLHRGDEVTVRGRLVRIAGPANPGEFDLADHWRDRGVSARLAVPPGDGGIEVVRSGWAAAPAAWLGRLREAGHAALAEHVPAKQQAVARALLLGEGAPMTGDDWGRYVRTGVVHVLAISGQHLVVVAVFLWWLLRLAGVRQRRAAVAVALALLGYALLTGGRPPAMRAAVGACAVCGALVLRRSVPPANLFALAWLVVAAIDPTDLFTPGCQLSFLAVAVLCWGASWLLRREEEDKVDAADQERSTWMRLVRWLGRKVYESYAVCLIVWLAVTPLAASYSGVLAPAALLLGPPLTLLTSAALLLGFLLFGLAWLPPAADAVGRLIGLCLVGCEGLVGAAEAWPVHVHVGRVPLWWLLIFYVGLLAVLTQPPLRERWRWAVPAALAWLCVGLLPAPPPRDEPGLRCTFLSVGHGGCVVLETGDGRVLLYDVGSMRGPGTGAATVAPFLWSRGCRRIDEVVLSHADLDHINALPELLDRFAVGRVLVAPTFADRQTPAAKEVLAALERRRVPVRAVAAGDRLRAAGLTINVLHPPRGWTGDSENARSVVLEVRHAAGVVLLTGDLEKEGLARLLSLPKRSVSVMQAPHHGSHRLDAAELVRWCRPGLVVSCQAARRDAARSAYTSLGALFWTTHEHGAVVVEAVPGGLRAEAFRTGDRLTVRPPAAQAMVPSLTTPGQFP